MHIVFLVLIMTERPVIQEIIVVEGRDDTTAINRAVEADTIETNGSAVNQQTLKQIKLAASKRGIIVFTDPDFAGERIRKIVSRAVPTAKQAFLPLAEARPATQGSVGVEHATPEAIRAALVQVYTPRSDYQIVITNAMLAESGLIDGPGAKSRRIALGDLLGIGYANSKQLLIRLNMFQIARSTFEQAIQTIKAQERDE